MEKQAIEELKAKHVGKCLALKDDEVVAICDSYEEVCKIIKKKGISGAYIFYCPTDEEEGYGFLFEVAIWK